MLKKLFYAGIVALLLFEAANVYFIMPMPFSQRMRSIDLAYAIYSWRWVVRAVCGALILAGAGAALRPTGRSRIPALAALTVAALAVYALNF